MNPSRLPGEVSPAPWPARAARLRAMLWRFRTLALAERAFAGATGPLVLSRRFYGWELTVNVSRSNAQRLLYLEGERFIGERRLLASLVRPGMRVADVGANIGYLLLYLARLAGPEGEILAFEPEPDNLVELGRNVRRNALDNVEVFPTAVGAADGTVSLRTGLNGTVAQDGTGEVEVPLRALDSALDRRIDFLKIDVEGYEGQVLAGAERVLFEDRPVLFVEVHPGLLAPPTTVDSLVQRLRELYPVLDFYDIHTEAGAFSRLFSRYLGRGAQRITDAQALLAACRAGDRTDPFWLVARCAS